MCRAKKSNSIKSIAVLLAVYNGKEWVEEQIQSILNQTSINISIFISIDPSTDSSEDVCFALQQEYKQITVLPVDQKFGSAAPNFFRLIRDVDISKFDYIALADQDDIWNLDKLVNAVDVLNKKNCAGYSSNVTAFWPDGRKELVQKADPQQEWDFLFESPGPGCTFVMNKKLAIDLQNFLQINQQEVSSVWVHDWFIYAYARANGYSWFIDENPSMLYRQHQNNEIGVNNGKKALLHRAKFILSGKAMEQSSLIATLCRLETNSFVKKWHQHSRFGMLYLATKANKCRRKPSHRIYFILSCLLLFIVGRRSS